MIASHDRRISAALKELHSLAPVDAPLSSKRKRIRLSHFCASSSPKNKSNSNPKLNRQRENRIARSKMATAGKSPVRNKSNSRVSGNSSYNGTPKSRIRNGESENISAVVLPSKGTNSVEIQKDNNADHSPVCPVTEVDEESIKKSIPTPIKLPLFLPTQNIHENWVYCRVFSEEIHSTFDKHMKKFEGEYLSRYLLGEIFHEKVNDEDLDFDPSIFFQAVEVTKISQLFTCGNNRMRLVIDCKDIPTANNVHLNATEARKIIAEGSLAELLASSSKKGDYFLIFGDIMLEQSKLITLNSRYQHPVAIAQYRHDGIFNPPKEHTKEFIEFCRAFRNPKLTHTFEEHEESEVLIKIQPNIPELPSETVMMCESSQDSFVPELRRGVVSTSSSTNGKRKMPLSLPSVPTSKHIKRNHELVQSNEEAKELSESDSDLEIDIVKEIEEHRILDVSHSSSRSVSPTPAASALLDSSKESSSNKALKKIFDSENSPEQNNKAESKSQKHGQNESNKTTTESEDIFGSLQVATQYNVWEKGKGENSESQVVPLPVSDEKEKNSNNKVQTPEPLRKGLKDCSVKLEPLSVTLDRLRKEKECSFSSISQSPELFSSASSRSTDKQNRKPKRKK